MFKNIIVTIAVLLSITAEAQERKGVSTGNTIPIYCQVGDVFILTSGSIGIYQCTTLNTWTLIQPIPASGGGLPAGLITITLTSCPAGFDEATELNGITLVGTLAANGNVGTTAGNDNITPAGTNSALAFTGSSASTNNVSAGTPAGTINSLSFTGNAWSAPAIAWPAGVPTHTGTTASFTGNALATHAHELPFHGGTTPRVTAGYGTGTSIAGVRSLTNAAQTTAQAVLLSQAITAGTPSGSVSITSQGTIAWPAGIPTIGAYTPVGTITAPIFTGSALGTHGHTVTATGTINTPSFTGTQFDNRSAFIRVIFCRKT